jgi:antirestriction protein
MITLNKPMIYVTTESAIEAGQRWGRFIIATQEVDVMEEEIKEMLQDSSVVNLEKWQWEIKFYDGFYSVDLGKNPKLEDVVKVANFIQEHGEIAAKVINKYCDGLTDDGIPIFKHDNIDKAIRVFHEGYWGWCQSVGDYAEQLWYQKENPKIPDELVEFINWEKVGQDMESKREIICINNKQEVHIFQTSKV